MVDGRPVDLALKDALYSGIPGPSGALGQRPNVPLFAIDTAPAVHPVVICELRTQADRILTQARGFAHTITTQNLITSPSDALV